ncbi:MAG: sterol desaturase family protein [Spirochaetia bacterium]|nr:sterol desaturase family protein [Spirochaetia bacterium]
MTILLTVLASVFVAEFLGYWIHTLLHSEKIPFLSREHMQHHLNDYGPGSNQRSNPYKDSGVGRFTFLGLGAEWLVPIVPVTISWVLSLLLLGVSLWLTLLSAGTGLFWGYLMFGLVHENFHIEGTGFMKNRFVRPWFIKVRRLHDIHHHKLTDEGRMPYNMGICFYFFDRLFGTYRANLGQFNDAGFAKSRILYQDLVKNAT